MNGQAPPEKFPQIGTVEDPALFRDCDRNLLLSYEIAPIDGGGNAILQFSDVVYYEQNPNNVHEGLRHSQYSVRPWDFTEILGSDLTDRWSSRYCPRRFWTISFNDWMVEIVFSGVKLVQESQEGLAPDAGLLRYLTTPR